MKWGGFAMSRGNPSRLIAREQLCCRPTARLVLAIDKGRALGRPRSAPSAI